MSSIVQKKGAKFTISSKYLLIILTMICVAFMGISIFTTAFDEMISNSIGTLITPFQKGISYVGAFFDDKVENLQTVKGLVKKNHELMQTVEDLQLEINRLQQDKYELNHLQQLFKIDKQYESYEKVGARIIASDQGNWYHSFTIDKGSEDGILEYMNVIADGGLVGIITKVGPKWSTVTAIISDDMNVSAQILSTEDNFIVSGDLALMKKKGTLSFSQLLDDGNVQSGDKVVTSFISDKFLQGFVIGYIDEIKTDANNLTRSGTILPAVNFNKLDEVLVVTTMKEKYEN